MLFDATELFLNRRSKKKVPTVAPDASKLLPPKYELVPFVEYTDIELVAARGDTLLFDIECYRNYFLIAFRSFTSRKVTFFEYSPDSTFNREKLDFVIRNFKLISFNGRAYDVPMMTLAYYGGSCENLKTVSDKLVDAERTGERYGSKEFEKEWGLKYLTFDHIDLIDVAPLKATLKLYAGRLHCKTMQDLPFDPSIMLTREQAKIILYYCINDLDNTALLYKDLKKQIELRESLSEEYNQDLRSRSDAQIAEYVIGQECERLTGYWAKRPIIPQGTIYNYNVPDFIQFQSEQMQTVLNELREAAFIISEKGRPTCEYLNGLTVTIGQSIYRMGVGGLHSSETCISHIADDDTILCDIDVESFYPRIILNCGLFPQHLTKAFLEVYESLVNRRIKAKKLSKDPDLTIAEMNKIISDSIKITINGSFGKLGSKWSRLYSPDLLIQVTLTGQLSLLMLIEEFERRGMSVVSANTDGIVMKIPKSRYEEMKHVVSLWENHTKFKMEETQYKAIYSRDVNNYIAIKKYFDKKRNLWVNEFPEGTKREDMYKGKGKFSEPDIWKNPNATVCVKALVAHLMEGLDLAHSIRANREFTDFVTVRTVKGGAYQRDQFIGKAVRWYYAEGEEGTINYILSGNKVPESLGAKPIMVLPDEFPADLNYDWYIDEANRLLGDIGYFGHRAARDLVDYAPMPELFDDLDLLAA